MNTVVESIIAQAMQMQPQERALIAERLISSLDTEVDEDVEIAWQQEVQRRIAELDNAEVVCLPWEEVLRRLRKNGRAST
jgi:putative addiction module component (TIGR02574 family)